MDGGKISRKIKTDNICCFESKKKHKVHIFVHRKKILFSHKKSIINRVIKSKELKKIKKKLYESNSIFNDRIWIKLEK